MIKDMIQVFFAPVLTLLSLAVMVARNPLLSGRKKGLFYGACVLLLLIIVSIWIDSTLVRFSPSPRIVTMRKIANFAHYCLAPIAPMVLAMLHQRNKKNPKWYFYLPGAVVVGVNIVGLFNGCVVKVTEENTVEPGPMHFLIYLIGGIYLLLLLNRAMGQHYRPNRQAEGALITSAIIVFAVAIVLEVVYGLQFVLWSIAVAFLMLYFLQLNVEKVAFDPLTGTHSQVAFSSATKKMRRGKGKDSTIAMVDMNGLKFFNDTYGHSAGNDALKQMSGAILAATEGQHMRVYRHGGDEFVVVAMRLCREEMESLLENALHQCGEVEGVPVSYAYGVAEFHSGDDLRTTISEADERMYAHKKATSPMVQRTDHTDLEEI